MIEKLSYNEAVDKRKVSAYKKANLPLNERVADLLHRMTVEEKVAQMLCIWGQRKTILFDQDGNLNLTNLELLKQGIGQIARLSDIGDGQSSVEMAELANALQRFFLEETRLGIPVIFHEECLHGLAGKDATSYPQPIGLASSFNPALVEEIYSAIAEETRSRGAHQALTPVVDVARDPRWGRVEETFGEDPYLVAQMGLAAVKGFQGDATFKDKKRVIATLKHFAAHGQPESGTNCGPVNVSERLLRDTFLYPFKEAIQKGNALSVMASYNEIDGVPSHASKWLLRDVLRGEWGFEGSVVSDYYAITELHHREEAISHSLAGDKTEAALLAVEAGVNIEFPDPDCYPNLIQLVRDGRLNESRLDELVAPLLRQKFLLGLFEDPYVDPESIRNDARLERDRIIARRAACEVITLLKNDRSILPLNAEKRMTLAVIGPNADRIMLGGYSGVPKYYTTALQGIQERVGKNADVLYCEGCKITVGGSWNDDSVTLPDPKENKMLIAQSVATAQQADTIILVLGGNEQTSREAWSKTHLGDRASLDLFGMQNELAEAVIGTGKPVVVLLLNGRPNSVNYISKHAHALVECWYLGQETGHALADVLFGDYNPSGKLPISIPRSAGHIPCFYNHKPSAQRGYLFDDVTPLYQFGYGLSYTTFAFSNLKLSQSTILVGGSTTAQIDVKNTGKYAGEEVVQMYIRDLVSSITRPVMELKGFKKIKLQPGETATVAFEIEPDLLAFTNIDKEFIVEPGDFEIMVGSSSRNQDLTKTILHVR